MSFVDVAIIGGGAAGAYSAYRLVHARKNERKVLDKLRGDHSKSLNVQLYEMSNRIGGRLWSHSHPELENIPVEIGGQAFNKSHQNVYGLCQKELNLKLRLRPSRAFNGGLQFNYLRKHRFQHHDFSPHPGIADELYYPNIIPYFLEEKEKWKTPDELVIYALCKDIPGFREAFEELTRLEGRPPEADLKQLKKFVEFLRCAKTIVEGVPRQTKPKVYQHGFWNLLSEELSNEAYDLISYSSFSTAGFRNYNLYDACLALAKGNFYSTFVELSTGYQSLPKELIKRFERKGGKTNLCMRLLRLDYVEHDASFKLTFVNRKEKYETIKARSVILALPRHALNSLDRNCFLFSEDSRLPDYIDTVTGIPASKLFLSYKTPWWEQSYLGPGRPPPKRGYSTTDLPLRGCYYIGSDPKGQALLNASLSDGVTQQFWKGFLQEARNGDTNSISRCASMCIQESGIPEELKEMVQIAQLFLREVHGLDQIPEPEWAFFHSWAEDPFGGGWHSWNTHVESWKVMRRVRKPVPGKKVFICGEAYSADQGWVEGALNTAEMVLEKYFGLSRPSWVHKDYEMGP